MIEYRLLPEDSPLRATGQLYEEVFIDTTPEPHRHLDGAGVLTLDGFIALSQQMRLDDLERREII